MNVPLLSGQLVHEPLLSSLALSLKIVYLLKTAWTEVSFVIGNRQFGAAPEHAPLQFTNCLPAGGTAVSMTVVPCVNLAEQLPPQFN